MSESRDFAALSEHIEQVKAVFPDQFKCKHPNMVVTETPYGLNNDCSCGFHMYVSLGD